MAVVRPTCGDISFDGMSKTLAMLIIYSDKKDVYRHSDGLSCILPARSPILEFTKRNADAWKLKNWPPEASGGNAVLIDRWLTDRIVAEAKAVWLR